MRRLASIFIMLLALSVTGWGQTTYYVDGTGSNGNAGTQAFPWQTITYAISQVSPGDIISVAAGTYTENFNINKKLHIIGAGSGTTGGTIITQTPGGSVASNIGVVQLSASGASASDPILLQDLRIEPEGMAGISVGLFTQSTGASVSYIKLDNVHVVGTGLTPCTEQERGFYVDLTSSASNLVFEDCVFDNLAYGWYIQKAVSADASTVSDVAVSNCSFSDNLTKGIYAEKLNNATFTGCTVDGNGPDASLVTGCANFIPWMAGVDINLKAGTYGNITFTGCTITDNAIDESKEGVGLTVKARDDATSYNTYPASVSGVTVTNCTITGNERGVRYGEPGKNNATPTNVTMTGNTINSNRQNYSGIDGSSYGDIINVTSANSVTVDGQTLSSGISMWYVISGDAISSVITASEAGDIITIGAGTYAASLNVSKSLTLQSTVASGSSTGAPVIQGLVTVGADDVTIKGLKLTNPSGNAIYAAGRSNLAILDNLFEAVGTTSTTNVHAITLTGSSTASTEILDDVLIDGNAFSNIGNPSGSQSSSAITVGFSTHSFELTNLVITENVISDVNANITNKGAYGILINVGANGSGNVTAPIISTNTISDLEGYWAHAIGMEGNTPNALVEDNVISDVTDHKATPDAVAVMVEDNANAGTLTIRNNYFLQNVAVGVVRTSSCTGTVNASNNYWNDNDGPCTPTLYSGPGCTGYGAGVTDNVVFEPWIGQATVMPAATIPNTTMDIGDDDITGIELQYDAVPETGGTIYITTYDTAPAGTTAPVGASVYKYVEITSDMPNGTFGIWITLTVTAGSQAGNFLETPADADVKRLAYFNESTNSWVLVSGSYSSLPASTAGVFDNATGTAEFTFFADHFTVFAFIGGSSASYYNTPATAYPLYVAMAPVANLNLASNRTVYPNNTWSGGYPGRTDDWGFSGTQPITVYLVPGNSSTFFSGSTTLQWTNGMLGSTVSVSASDGTYNGLFTGANRILDSDMLGTTNSIRIDAARSDNLNYDPAVTGEEIATGDFIVKLGLQLLKPGSTGIDVIGADYRRYVNATSPPQYVYVEPFGTTIKAYLGDVANSSDQTSGDGLINTDDLTPWAASYWSGVSGFSGGLTNYKTKFDIGPTTNGTPFTLPVPDTKIEFEDLVIFSISYGLSAANALPKYDENPGSIGLELGAPVRNGGEIRVPVLLNGTNADVRALKLRLDGVTGRFLGFEHGELLAGRGNPVPVFSMQDDSRLAIDLAVLGLDEQPIAGSGELLWLRFDATEMPRISEAEARTSLNRSIRVALNDATAAGFSLAQNYPNPFNPSTTITFTLDRDAEIDLSVYNTFGQKVATILSGSALAGTQQVSWNGTDDAGSALPSGVYIYRLSAGGNTLQRSMMLAK